MGGGDKCLRTLGGVTILARVLERVRSQVNTVILNAQGDPDRFAETGLPVVEDVVGGYVGPLAGALTGMTWAIGRAPDCRWIATFPTDAPFLPSDLVARMRAAVEREDADMACAASGERPHPVVGLWPVRLREALRRAIVDEGMRKIDGWTARYRLAVVAYDSEPIDPFFNINTLEDLQRAEQLLDEQHPAS